MHIKITLKRPDRTLSCREIDGKVLKDNLPNIQKIVMLNNSLPVAKHQRGH